MSTRTLALLLAGAGLVLSTTACTTNPAATTTPTAGASAPAGAQPGQSSAPAGAPGNQAGAAVTTPQVRFADEGAFPFQVSILNLKATDENGKPATDDRGRQSCGGSMLDDRHVLTAAHCFAFDAAGAPDPKRDYRVVVGRTTLTSKQGQVHRIAEYKVHPRYSDRPTTSYDVAVVTLDRPVTGIEPVTLVAPGDPSLMRVGSMLTFTGWGSATSAQDEGGSSLPASDRLKQVSVPMMAGDACVAAYKKHPNMNPPDMRVALCTSTAAGIGHCYGDSGSPLWTTDGGRVVQLGVVSFAAGCGDKRYPSVYARLNKGDINSFIRKTAGLN